MRDISQQTKRFVAVCAGQVKIIAELPVAYPLRRSDLTTNPEQPLDDAKAILASALAVVAAAESAIHSILRTE